MGEQKRHYGSYKPRGTGVPRRQCARFLLRVNPVVGMKLRYLAGVKGVSFAVLLETIIENNTEIKGVKA